MNEKKQCIITFANEKGNYIHGLARLSESLRNNFDGDLLAWVNEGSLGCEKHVDNPYNFKVHAFLKAIESGYKQILWLDCSAFAVANVKPIFDLIDKKGLFFQEAGHYLGSWTNDNSLNYFELTREEANKIPMVQGGFIGLNIDNHVAKKLFRSLDLAMDAGVFKGEWSDHRHEMSALSAIVYRHNLWKYVVSGNQFIQYGGIYDQIINETIVLKCQGL